MQSHLLIPIQSLQEEYINSLLVSPLPASIDTGTPTAKKKPNSVSKRTQASDVIKIVNHGFVLNTVVHPGFFIYPIFLMLFN